MLQGHISQHFTLHIMATLIQLITLLGHITQKWPHYIITHHGHITQDGHIKTTHHSTWPYYTKRPHYT